MLRVAPLLPLNLCERDARVKHGREHVHKWHTHDDRIEEVGAEVGHSAHGKAPRASPLDAKLVFGGPLFGDEVLSAGHKVRERVLLVQVLAVLIPEAAHVTAATHVGNCKHESSVQQREALRREVHIIGNLVGSVGVQQKRVTAVTLEGRLAVHQGNGHLGPIFCRGPQPLRDVVVPVKASAHGLNLLRDPLGGSQIMVQDCVGGGEGRVVEPQQLRVEVTLRTRVEAVHRLIELKLLAAFQLCGC
mmetsp:Transcript_18414/g.55508  ORF Transcript_18414/g.55508 Transcript_18414/m.55508 type:complete len:246 (+) Transcript_18414:1356-2093(+)